MSISSSLVSGLQSIIKEMDEWKSYSFASAMHVVGMGTPRSAKKAWSSNESESAQQMASM